MMFIQLTEAITDQPVLVNPELVPAIVGSFIHLYGGGITVHESHEQILELIREALDRRVT